MCGGTISSLTPNTAYEGLSPRVRGHPLRASSDRCRRGSIPACVGAPPRPRQSCTASGVYPRVCGGTGGVSLFRIRRTGLSPRVRGHLLYDRRRLSVAGSFPACAGAPSRARMRLTTTWVYPRVCGGTERRVILKVSQPGLSPRVRGHRFQFGDTLSRRGSIPACAGAPQT